MKIKVVRDPSSALGSGHVSLYAWSDSSDDAYLLENGSSVNSIKFDFFPHVENTIEFGAKPTNYFENHNAVILESNVSFQRFCEELAKSEFKDATSFNLDRNCVHSVKKALEIANINIAFDETPTCKHLAACLCWPTTLTTPRELIAYLKEYKNRQYFVDDEIEKNSDDEERELITVTPLQQSGVQLTDEQFKQLQIISALETAAIRDERMGLVANLCYFSSFFCIAGGTISFCATGSLFSCLPNGFGAITMISSNLSSMFCFSRARKKAAITEEYYEKVLHHSKPS